MQFVMHRTATMDVCAHSTMVRWCEEAKKKNTRDINFYSLNTHSQTHTQTLIKMSVSAFHWRWSRLLPLVKKSQHRNHTPATAAVITAPNKKKDENEWEKDRAWNENEKTHLKRHISRSTMTTTTTTNNTTVYTKQLYNINRNFHAIFSSLSPFIEFLCSQTEFNYSAFPFSLIRAIRCRLNSLSSTNFIVHIIPFKKTFSYSNSFIKQFQGNWLLNKYFPFHSANFRFIIHQSCKWFLFLVNLSISLPIK